MRIILFLALLLHILSCSENSDLKRSLYLSGNNRTELEKVIFHFSQNSSDSLKLKAACFLIENMPGHYSLTDPYITNYYHKVDSQNSQLPVYIKNILYSLPQYYVDLSNANKVEDIQIIKSDYLIKHIDKMFHLWRSVPWGKDISFKTFCEYILPYRIDNEPLSKLMENYYYFPIDSFSQQLHYHDITANEFLYNYIWRLLPQSSREFNLPDPIVNNYIADCIWDSYRTLIESKICCIPAVIDFTPCWPMKNGKHFWNAIDDPCLIKKTFSENYIDHYAKVYRKTYSRNPIPENNGIDFVPFLFQSPFNKDVTDLYCKTSDVMVSFDTIPDHTLSYAYLSVFNEGEWQSVAWGEVLENQKVYFKNVGLKCVYLPIYFSGKKEKSGGYPFIIGTMKTVHKLTPDKHHLIKVRLTRKYPVNSMAYGLNDALKHITFEGCETSDFRQKETFCIKNLENKPLQEIELKPQHQLRFWRLLPNAPKGSVQIAEIYFYDHNNNLIPNNMLDYLVNTDKTKVENVFDNDPLTFSIIDSTITMDFSKLTTISKVNIMPRNDDNNVIPGVAYELLYRDKNGWVSLGTKISLDYFIEYDNVPSGALYWLRNLTKGIEERIFTIENEKQIFW